MGKLIVDFNESRYLQEDHQSNVAWITSSLEMKILKSSSKQGHSERVGIKNRGSISLRYQVINTSPIMTS